MRRRRESKFERPTRADSMGSAVFNAKDVHSMHNSLNSEFMLYQLILKRILSEKNKQGTATNGLYDFFKPEDEGDTRTMTEFDKTYKPSQAVFWYTRESCVYRMLNKALRTQNINHLLGFSTFICDLNKQLAQEQIPFMKKFKTPTIQVYRGQLISIDEVNRMKSGIGQLIAMNSFLSTSTNQKKAIEFATSRPPPIDTLTSILLEMNVPIGPSTRPFADIKHLSAFPSEEEILFMFGAVFRIDNLYEDKEKSIWRAKLTLCNSDDADYKAFMETLAKDLKGKDDLVSIGNYLLQMGKFDEAESHYQILIENNLLENDYDLATCYHGLAQTNTKKGDYDLALDSIGTALKYLSKPLNEKHYSLIAQCYNEYGSVYCKKGDYLLAFKYYEKALLTKYNNVATTYAGIAEIHQLMENYSLALEYQYKRLEQQWDAPPSMIANTYIDIGKIYSLMKQQEQASSMFNQAVKIQLRTLHPGHPDLGYTYSAVGLMYSEIGNEQKALEYIQKAYQLQVKSLPANHPDFCESYTHFGNLYLKKGDLDKALIYFKKLLDSQIKTLSEKHPSVADTYTLIGKVFYGKSDYKQALFYYKKSLECQLERKRFGDSSLSTMYKTIADIHLKNRDLDDALEYYHKLLDNDLERKVLEDQSFAETYKLIGDIYCEKGDFRQALFYYYRLLDCQLQARPFKDSAIVESYTMIGKIYLEKPYEQTLLRFNISLDDEIRAAGSANASLLYDHIIVGDIHFEKRHLDQAYNYFKQLLENLQKKEPVDRQALIDTLKILGNICTDRQDSEQSLFYLHELLKHEGVRQKPLDDPSLATTYKFIGKIYCDKNNFETGLGYYNRLLDSQLKTKPLNNALVNDTCVLIGKLFLVKPFHQRLMQFNELLGIQIQDNGLTDTSLDETLSIKSDAKFEQRHLDRVVNHFQQMLNDKDTTSLPSDLSLPDVYKILGNIAIEKNDWNHAVFYYLKLLEKRNMLSKQDPALIKMQKIIRNMYFNKRDFNQALKFFQQLLTDQLVSNPDGNSVLANIYDIIGNFYSALGLVDVALDYYRQSLTIYERMPTPNNDAIKKLKSEMRKLIVSDDVL
ncbi:unnamed protein product [Rotaria sordida]|uniref:ADP ribosyltransferase domain-containing protein n=1 Tax=Rotaria sordida TaxID=392033 RepID=A0A815CXS8_9BILA|nr:unnamed protein product [Rotaria sordida]